MQEFPSDRSQGQAVSDRDINLLDPNSIDLFFDETHHVAIRDRSKGTITKKLRVSLMFPITDRRSFVQLTDSDDHEIGIIRDLEQLDDSSRRVIEEELSKSYFIPRITAIESIEQKFGSDLWKVQTEKGTRRFEVVGKRRNVRFIRENHIVIRDIDGNRYEIPDFRSLDRFSQKLFTREI